MSLFNSHTALFLVSWPVCVCVCYEWNISFQLYSFWLGLASQSCRHNKSFSASLDRLPSSFCPWSKRHVAVDWWPNTICESVSAPRRPSLQERRADEEVEEKEKKCFHGIFLSFNHFILSFYKLHITRQQTNKNK